MHTFSRFLVQDILRRAHEYPQDNWDYLRFGPNPVRDRPGQIIFDLARATEACADIIDHGADYQWIHDTLADEASRRLLIDLLAYRVLGYAHVKLPTNTPAFWREYQTIDSRFLKQANVARSAIFDLHRYAVPVHGRVLQLINHPLGILSLLLGQYFFERAGKVVKPNVGDNVLDAGGCWGEAALAFASAVGPTGHVYSFEFVPNNLAIFQANLASCPEIAAIVTIIDRPLFHTSGQRLAFTDNGPGSRLTGTDVNASVTSLNIDDFVAGGIPRIDFIKMDIEGAEVAALEGARATLRQFKPRLAISVYHRPHDLFEIPRLIQQIEGSYRFYLDHYTIHQEETVLYAWAR